MKYIVYDTAEGPISAVIFAKHIDHAQMAIDLGIERENIYSAGFVHFDDLNGVWCEGFSTTLSVGTRPEDTQVIRSLMK
jgi:hypothetical protein